MTEEDLKPDSYWLHYKGGVYLLCDIATVEATGEKVVVYLNATSRTTWIRPINGPSGWLTKANVNGQEIDRFSPISNFDHRVIRAERIYYDGVEDADDDSRTVGSK
jgi:hypothetical protein